MSDHQHTILEPRLYVMKLFQISVELGVPEGMTTVIASQPFDTVKARLQTVGTIDYGEGEFLYNGPIDCFQKILKREGFSSLFRGMSLPLVTTVPVNIFTFHVYNILSIKRVTHGKKMTRKEILLNGAISGGLPACVISPVERFKFYMQIPHGYYGKIKTPTSIMGKIFRKEGISGFYRGTGLCFLRDSINTAVAFLVYYWLKIHVLKKQRQRQMDDAAIKRKRYLTTGLCGGISGVIATTLTIPIDFLKTRYQFSPLQQMPEIIDDIHIEADRRNISVMKLSYTGMPLILTRSFFHYAFMFLSFEVYKQLVRKSQVMERRIKEGITGKDEDVQDEIAELERREVDEYDL